MKKTANEELLALIEKAVAGDKESLETVILSVQDLVFNLSLRMLGTFPDAEDATQDILLKIITHLSSFRGGKRLFHLGIPHCHKPSEKLSKAYVRKISPQL